MVFLYIFGCVLLKSFIFAERGCMGPIFILTSLSIRSKKRKLKFRKDYKSRSWRIKRFDESFFETTSGSMSA